MRVCSLRIVMSVAAVAAFVGSAVAQMPGVGPQAYQPSGAVGSAVAVGPSNYGATQTAYAASENLYPQYVTPQSAYGVRQTSYADQYAPAGPVGSASPCTSGSCTSSYESACGSAAWPSCALNDCGRGQCWTFRADEVFIQRSTTRSQALLYADDLSTESLNSQTGLNFPVATGFQVSAARQLWGCWSVEAGYFHLDGWEARASVPGDSYIVTDVNGGYFGVTDAYARYISAIYLGEINARYQWGDRLSLLAGFRMGELDERYRATGTEGAGIATLTSDAFNHLYGFQIGADAEVIRAGALRINGLCKAGVYANSASQATRRFDDFLDESQTATKNHTAFLGEAGLALTYQFSEHLAARAVYQAVWLEGVALAPEQLGATDFAGTAVVDTAGSMFYHGGGIGLELTF